MDLFEALGEEVGRAFGGPGGRRGAVPRHYFYEPDAAERLAEALAAELAGRTALVLTDVRTRPVSAALFPALERAGFAIRECRLEDGPGGASPICDDVTKDRLLAGLPQADLFVAAGAGVVNDLAKWLAAERGVRYGVFATAASMNGYSAANVAPSIAGVKTLFRAAAPIAIAADPRVIEAAPGRLTSAGLGDVIAKPVSTADWILNHHLFGEPFSAPVARVINRLEPIYLDGAQGLARREPGAVRGLFEALVWSGCAMTLQGSSLPASGGEHLISHTLDMLAHVGGVEHDLHGRQVGVATIFAAALYERVLALPAPRFEPVPIPFDAGRWGPIAAAVQVEHAKKTARMGEACARLNAPGVWATARGEMAAVLLPAARIQACLRDAGAAHRIADLGCSRERFLAAALACGAIRGRFTSIDLAWAAGVLPGAAEEIADRWLA